MIKARRAYLDLIGLPPAPAEADEFLNDRSPDAWEKLIDKLLASPRYGERWGRHWLVKEQNGLVLLPQLQNNSAIQTLLGNATLNSWWRLPAMPTPTRDRYEALMDNNNPDLAKARALFDIAQAIKFNYVYRLPIGTGHMVSYKPLNPLISGWQISGIF
jgi:peptidoglycan/xylan/chitin deacetylase (PgdA/CDA1 family)